MRRRAAPSIPWLVTSAAVAASALRRAATIPTAAAGAAPAAGATSTSGACPFSGSSAVGADRGACPVEGAEATIEEPHPTPKQIINLLGKAKLSAFVTSTASAGYVLSCGLDPFTFTAVTVGTYLQSLSANTANQCIEVENDRMMKRTHKRPLVIGAITRQGAASLSAVELAAGTALLYAGCNPLTAALGIANWIMYVGVYTPLKRVSTTNTWWGAIVGAIPPLMGGAAATGGLTSPLLGSAYVLAGVMFVWQIPHFMSLAFHCRRDYETAGFKMLPFSHPTRASVYAVSMSVVLAALTIPAPAMAGVAVEPWYYAASTVANAGMIFKSVRFHMHPEKYCRACFVYSYMYLAFMLAFLVANHFRPQQALTHLLFGRSSSAAATASTEEAAADAKL